MWVCLTAKSALIILEDGCWSGRITSRDIRKDGLSCRTDFCPITGTEALSSFRRLPYCRTVFKMADEIVLILGVSFKCLLFSGKLFLHFRSQAEMAHTCRGTINLAGAFIDSEDSCSFVISNGGTQVFYMRASSEVERQRWVTALELAKAKAIKMLESGLCIFFYLWRFFDNLYFVLYKAKGVRE